MALVSRKGAGSGRRLRTRERSSGGSLPDTDDSVPHLSGRYRLAGVTRCDVARIAPDRRPAGAEQTVLALATQLERTPTAATRAGGTAGSTIAGRPR